MRLLLSALLAYLIGSIPTGYLITRSKQKIDLRKHGSGSTGATNVFRTAGKIPALFTLIFDILKGFITASILVTITYNQKMTGLSHPMYASLLGLLAVLGHNFPVFLKFKGGKGIATSAGVLLALGPQALFIGLCTWLLVFAISRIVSLSSIIASIVIPVSSLLFEYPIAVKGLIAALGILTIIRHKENIKRLLKGEEKRIVKGEKS